MNQQLKLIDVPVDRPSLKVRIAAFKQTHGILTHRSACLKKGEHPWIALIPMEEHKGQTIFQIMSEWARLYHEADAIGFGDYEVSAIRELMLQRREECDL